jgi:hypothetical protein
MALARHRVQRFIDSAPCTLPNFLLQDVLIHCWVSRIIHRQEREVANLALILR